MAYHGREGAHHEPRPAGDVEHRVLGRGAGELDQQPQRLLVADAGRGRERHGLLGELLDDEVAVRGHGSVELPLRDRHMSRLARDAREPGADVRVAPEVEVALVGNVRVGVERDVGDRVALRDEEAPLGEVPLHHVERPVAALHLLPQPVGLDLPAREHLEPRARYGDVRLVAVLLEEHPAQHVGAREALGGEEGCPLGQVEEDRVRLGEVAAVVELEDRDAPVRIQGEEIGRARLALRYVLLDQGEAVAELREEEADLVAVTGRQVVVELHRGACTTTARRGETALLLSWKEASIRRSGRSWRFKGSSISPSSSSATAPITRASPRRPKMTFEAPSRPSISKKTVPTSRVTCVPSMSVNVSSPRGRTPIRRRTDAGTTAYMA